MSDVAPVMLVNVVPPSVLTCHCTVSAPPGFALAVVKETLWARVGRLVGGLSRHGVDLQRRRIAVLNVPALLVNTAWYSSPFWDAVAVKL